MAYATQTTFSFDGRVAFPAQVAVFDIDGPGQPHPGSSKSLYLGYDYTVNWTDKTITLINPILLGNRIRIDVYEVGNGDQLVKSNTQNIPIHSDPVTGMCEIHLDCNYSASMYEGSGVVTSGSIPEDVIVTATTAADNTLSCNSVTALILNAPITFTGDGLGGIALDTVYYIKSISLASKRITISITNVSGVAGPVMTLTDDAGTMNLVAQVGTADVYTAPIVHANGVKLIKGSLLNVTSSKSSNNALTCNTTIGLFSGTPIVFANTIFGGVITPMITYYIKTIVDSNEFTISETNGGASLTLTDGTGGAIAVTDDYTFDQTHGGPTAKIVFSKVYNHMTDYITFTVFGETEPQQYGYTLPETEVFTGTTDTVYALSNYVGGANPTNAVVEFNGRRLTETTDYTIDSGTNELTLVVAPGATDTIAVTSFNLTERQYFHTQYGVSGKTVADISYISNEITSPLAEVRVTGTNSGTKLVTYVPSTSLIIGQTVIFRNSTCGNILGDGTVFFILTTPSTTTFTMSLSPGGPVFDPGTASPPGVLWATIGGKPAVRVTTGVAHGLSTNDLIRIDGVVGSFELNNVLFYAHKIDNYNIDLYSSEYLTGYTAVNYPITMVSTYISGGHIWGDGMFTLLTTTVTATLSADNRVQCVSVADLIIDTTILFTEEGKVAGELTMGGIVVGQKYYINFIDTALDQIRISETYQGLIDFVLLDDTGTTGLTQWEQLNVDRLWVTINGWRVPSSSMRLNPLNSLSLMIPVAPSDDVIITNMITTPTPNELTYFENIYKNGSITSVYNANQQTRTWLTDQLDATDSTISVMDVTKITTETIQYAVVPMSMLITLNADKRILTQVIVYNDTTMMLLDPLDYEIVIQSVSPTVKILNGALVGHALTITSYQGNLIYVNGEQIKFKNADRAQNILSGLQRGSNGTGVQQSIPVNTLVYGVLSQNKLPSALYASTFTESDLPDNDGDIDGGPLQFFDTPAATFLQRDIR